MTADAVKRLVVPGKSLRLNFGKNNRNNELLHVRGIIDENMIVTRSWVKHKRWVYEVKHIYHYEIMHQLGYLERAK